MKVALLQTDIAWEDREANLEALPPQLEAAAAGGARLLILPETFSVGFSMDAARVAESPDGPSTAFLRTHARRLGVWIAGSIPVRTRADARPHNTLVVAGPAGELDRYRKIHLFTHHGEHEHYAPGDAPFVRAIEGVRIAFFVCYDLRFADAFWDLADRVDAYVVVANWPEARREHWRVLLRARAIENQAYVLGVNRVGGAGDATCPTHAGDSAIIDPIGRVLVEAARDPTTLLGELDPARVAETRRHFPALRDRRTAGGDDAG